MILIRRLRSQWPSGVPRVDPRWIARGLKSLYLLRSDIWAINLVTGRVGGSLGFSGPTFPDGWMLTSGATANGVYLEHGLSVDIALPITIVAGWTRISGSVSWSLLDDEASTWTGWYGEATGDVKATQANNFSGLVSLGTHNTAVAQLGANNLRGSGGRGVVTDSAVSAPSGVSRNVVTIGWSKRSISDNWASARFTHWGAFQGALTDSELQELGAYPMRLLEPQRIFVPMQAASSGLPTLTALTASNITTSGWRATLTAA